MDSENTLGYRIKSVRQRAEQKQSDFARELGISQSHLSGIEKGTVNPSLTLIKLICMKYNASEEWLLTGHGTWFVSGSSNLFSRDGCNARFKDMSRIMGNMVSECYNDSNEDNIISLVSAYSYAVAILSYPLSYKDKEKSAKYLKLIMSIFDELEKYIYNLKSIGVAPTSILSISKINHDLAKISELYDKH